MIEFNEFELDNGLKVIVHEDQSTPIAAVNILYNVGARDENPVQTGFAHLFEHLMFGGSKNIPLFDEPLQQVGGENNAFTSNDLTNYYITLPVQNLETAFWLESDRMNELAFTDKSLTVQKNVVIEEFRQRYLNQPYGDVWLHLRPLAYKIHPYRWPTIGKEISHIEDATMQDVKDFFYKYYRPNNAILSVAGNVKTSDIERLAKKWFGDIEPGDLIHRSLPKEPKQTEAREKTLTRDVPYKALYKAFHMPNRLHSDYHAIDLLSDVLSRGASSRFYTQLIKEKGIFSEINAYVSGDLDEGLFVISGIPMQGVDFKVAENAISDELNRIIESGIDKTEHTKVLNKVKSIMKYEEINVLNKAMNLAIYELIESAELINNELNNYNAVSANDISNMVNKYLTKENSSTIYYQPKEAE